jgi:hypothetical protein
MAKPSITKKQFEALARRAGIPLTAQQIAELHKVYDKVAAMTVRVRGGGQRAPAAEPAAVFKPKA